jgi:diamine N-acetyltransferase
VTTPWRVRRASPADAAPVSVLGAALFRQAYEPTHPEPTLSEYLEAAFDPGYCEQVLRDPHAAVLIAESESGEWIGYVHIREALPDATARLAEPLPGARPLEIVRFYVDAAWHGRGVAQQLMAECDAEARARSCDIVWVQAWQPAAQALAFYRKCGFRVIGTATFHFGDRRDDDFILARPPAP